MDAQCWWKATKRAAPPFTASLGREDEENFATLTRFGGGYGGGIGGVGGDSSGVAEDNTDNSGEVMGMKI